MPALGVTGGIATGKSTFLKTFLRHAPAGVFDADQCAHELLAKDYKVQTAVCELFGTQVFNAEGIPDRALLRARVFEDPLARRQLEAILHPIIRSHWVALAESARSSKGWHCFDIPLLYETGAEEHFDCVIVVACSPATQRLRLRGARGLSEELAAGIIQAQLDLWTKINKSHHLIWNDSTPANLEAQTALLINWLQQRYG